MPKKLSAKDKAFESERIAFRKKNTGERYRNSNIKKPIN